jgi:hypothetical protein
MKIIELTRYSDKRKVLINVEDFSSAVGEAGYTRVFTKNSDNAWKVYEELDVIKELLRSY